MALQQYYEIQYKMLFVYNILQHFKSFRALGSFIWVYKFQKSSLNNLNYRKLSKLFQVIRNKFFSLKHGCNFDCSTLHTNRLRHRERKWQPQILKSSVTHLIFLQSQLFVANCFHVHRHILVAEINRVLLLHTLTYFR